MMIKNPRANTTMDLSSFTKNQAKRNNCKHLTVKSHLCQVCGSSLVSFKGSLFETQHGAVATVLNIKYVNEYFEQYAT
jgi:RNA polymerase subunit RPABC4/transcription elongation factor Spt4